MSGILGREKKYYIHLMIVFCLMYFFGFISAPEPITHYGMQIIGITLGAVWGWCFCDLSWPSLLALPALGMTMYGNTQAVLSGVFGQANVILMILAFLFFAPVTKSGLSQWIGMKLVTAKFTKGNPYKLTTLVYLGAFLISLLMNGLIIAIFIFQLFIEIFKDLGYEKGDKFVVMFLSGIFTSCGIGSCAFTFKDLPLVIFGLTASAGIQVQPISAIVFCLVSQLAFIMGWLLLMKLLRCDFSKIIHADFSKFEVMLREPLDAYKKTVLRISVAYIVIVCIVGILSKAHGNALEQFLYAFGVYGVLCVMLVYEIIRSVDGKPVLELTDAAKAVQWGFIFLLGIALFLSSAITSADTGIGQAAVKIIAPILATTGEYGFLLLLALITCILTNIANNVAMTMTMVSVVLLMVGQGLAINGAVAIMIVMYMGICSGMLLPSASAGAAMLFGSDSSTAKSFFVQGLMVMILFMLMAAFVWIPLGKLLF